MKNIILILFILCSIDAVAQEKEYYSFCEEGKVWNTDYYNDLSCNWSYCITILHGDTLIVNKTCKKCFAQGQYAGAFYDEGHCTYYIAPHTEVAELVYDFSVKKNDMIEVLCLYENEKKHLVVEDIGVVARGSRIFKAIVLTDGSTNDDGTLRHWTWIEGVGSEMGPLQANLYNMRYAFISSCTINKDVFFWCDEPYHLSSGEEIAEDNFDFIFRPFVQESKHWIVRRHITDTQEAGCIEYVLTGDTIIADQSCKKMFEGKEYIGAFFDANKYHTYFIPKGSENPYMYYNFCLWEGNSTHVWQDGMAAYLYCSNSISFNDTDHTLQKMRFVHFLNGADNNSSLLKVYASDWAEGVGSLNGPMTNFTLPGSPESSDELLACWTPDEIIYDPQGLAAAHFATIPKTNSPIYDLSGRKMTAPSAHGIYIEGGKKVMR